MLSPIDSPCWAYAPTNAKSVPLSCSGAPAPCRGGLGRGLRGSAARLHDARVITSPFLFGIVYLTEQHSHAVAPIAQDIAPTRLTPSYMRVVIDNDPSIDDLVALQVVNARVFHNLIPQEQYRTKALYRQVPSLCGVGVGVGSARECGTTFETYCPQKEISRGVALGARCGPDRPNR